MNTQAKDETIYPGRFQEKLAHERKIRQEAEAISEKITHELFQQRQSLQILQQIASMANEAAGIDLVLQFALDKICEHTNWPVGHVYLKNLKNILQPTKLWHLDNPKLARDFVELTEKTELFSGVGLPGRVMESGEPLWIRDVTLDENFPRNKEANNLGVKSAFAFPVKIVGQVVAIFEFYSREIDELDEETLGLAEHIGTQIAHAIERSQTNENLKNQNQMLEQVLVELEFKEMRNRAFIENAYDPFVAMNAVGTIVDWNPSAENMFGWDSKEILGRNVLETFAPYSLREKFGTDSKRFMTEWASLHQDKKVEMSVVHRNGEETLCEFAIKALEIGSTTLYFAFMHDLTEHKRIEEEINRAKEAALSADRAKSEFLANMSHEIRTPMNGVIGMTSLLLDTALTAEQRDFAETIRRSGDQLLTVINDILDFSKIEAGKLTIEIIDFDLRTTVEEVVAMLSERADQKKIELVSIIYQEVPTTLRGDPGRIRQILTNLVGNAVKFTEMGEVVVRTKVIEQKNNQVKIKFEVSDTGIGIPDEVIPRLFNSFNQADSSTTRKYGGTGLGLAISRRLIELMDGEIGVQSEPGKGSTFWFTVRLEKQANPVQTELGKREEFSELRVLIVDDNDTNRKILRHQLTAWGMRVDAAVDGLSALQKLQTAVQEQDPFRLVVLDMQMPGMDGLVLARLIKSNPTIAEVPLVLMTSLGQRGHAHEATAAGIVAYLTKPIRQAQLFDCLVLVMTRGRNKQEQPELITRHTIAEAQAQRRRRALVVEDNIINQKVAVLTLEKLNFRVDVALNGMEAVEAIARTRYSVVFMDCQMPEMDGYEATALIRKKELVTGEHVIIIAMTAHAMQGDREKCLRAGMDDYVSKPFQTQKIAALIEKWASSEQDNGQSDQVLLAAEEGTPSSAVSLTVDFNPQAFDALKRIAPPGNQRFLAEMVEQFQQDASKNIAALAQAVSNEDAEKLRTAAHTLKSSSANMGAVRMSELGRQLEELAQGGNLSGVKPVLLSLVETFSRTRRDMALFLKNENQSAS